MEDLQFHQLQTNQVNHLDQLMEDENHQNQMMVVEVMDTVVIEKFNIQTKSDNMKNVMLEVKMEKILGVVKNVNLTDQKHFLEKNILNLDQG